MKTPRHNIFRRMPWQEYLRCVGCGYVARGPRDHIAHANGRHVDGEEQL